MLALSKGPNRVGVSTPSLEDINRLQTKSNNPVIVFRISLQM
jgi:hypothetical protein